MTTELHPIEAGEILSYELAIAAPPEVVWRYWVEPERMVRWMGDVATLEPRAGGQLRIEYKTGDIAAGSYLELDEPRRLLMTWGWDAPDAAVPSGASQVEVTLEPVDDGAGTLLRLRHFGLPTESRPTHDEGWRFFLPRLPEAVAAA